MTQEIYDTIIIGGGPAGAGAAVYAARKRLKTLLVTTDFGGQSKISGAIENWLGEISITGQELADKLQKHVEAQEGVEIRTSEKVTEVREGEECAFEVETEKGAIYRSQTVIVASGGRRKLLNVPGEDRLKGKGLSFCSTCDAPFFEDRDAAVIGSGNAALEMVIDLGAYARKIYLFMRGEELKADPGIQEKIKEVSQLKIIEHAEVQEILGKETVSGLRYQDRETGKMQELKVDGIFLGIGSNPNSEIVRHLVNTNDAGEIILDHRTAKTSKPGVFAAGDVTDDPFKQNNISAGDGVRAALSVYFHILSIKKYSPCAVNMA
jgi:NADH-dependent peroxiredoxin subunit F